MKPSELPGARRLYRLTNRTLAQIRELWQYAGEDELPPDSLLQAQVEAVRILRIDVPLSANRQFQLFCSEHFPGLADILDCLAADQLWALLSRPGQSGGYAVFISDITFIRGYQRDSVGRQSPFNTWARICSKRWAPRSLQRICCFFTNRLLTTWLTADSANPVEMVFPCRYRSP